LGKRVEAGAAGAGTSAVTVWFGVVHTAIGGAGTDAVENFGWPSNARRIDEFPVGFHGR
jgi:hypothetical protein